jgi:predicted nucleic acid-binding protein
LNFQEMQVDKQRFPINVIDFNDKKVLVWLDVANTDKCKGIITGDPRALNENTKICSWEVVAKRTLDGGETLKIIIKSTDVGGQA